MALTDMQIRNIRPTGKISQHTDERGLYLEVQVSGSKLWRYKYRYMGKQKRLALGRYPDVGLAEARKRRDDARSKLDEGKDPLAERKREKLVAAFNAANTFADIAREYIDKRVAEGQSEATTQKANWLLEQLKPIWTFPVADIKPVDLLAALKRIEARGRERPFGDLAVDGRPRQPCAVKNGFETDDTVWIWHVRHSIAWSSLTPPVMKLTVLSDEERATCADRRQARKRRLPVASNCMASLDAIQLENRNLYANQERDPQRVTALH